MLKKTWDPRRVADRQLHLLTQQRRNHRTSPETIGELLPAICWWESNLPRNCTFTEPSNRSRFSQHLGEANGENGSSPNQRLGIVNLGKESSWNCEEGEILLMGQVFPILFHRYCSLKDSNKSLWLFFPSFRLIMLLIPSVLSCLKICFKLDFQWFPIS